VVASLRFAGLPARMHRWWGSATPPGKQPWVTQVRPLTSTAGGWPGQTPRPR